MAFVKHRARMVVPRRRRKFEWVHDSFNNVAAAALNNYDMLLNFKNQYGIFANFPEIVVWAIFLRYSTRYTLTTNAANDGVLLTMFVDSTKQTLVNQATNSNDEHYLLYKQLYATEVFMNSGVGASGTTIGHYTEAIIKSHRKIVNINDSLFLQTSYTGTVAPIDDSVSVGVLLRLP